MSAILTCIKTKIDGWVEGRRDGSVCYDANAVKRLIVRFRQEDAGILCTIISAFLKSFITKQQENMAYLQGDQMSRHPPVRPGIC